MKRLIEELKLGARIMRYDARKMFESLRTFLKWIIFAIITGLVVGWFSILFVKCLTWATGFREDHPQIIFALPLAGIVIVFLYGVFKYRNDKGTNLVISTIHAESEIPLKMAPLIFISTVLTHMFGGSAGREGAALQLGGSIGNQLGRIFRLDEKDTRVIVMCGMSAAFSAIFGTPMAAAIFSLEVVSVGIMYYAALVPCVFASLVASMFATSMEIDPEFFVVYGVTEFTVRSIILMTLLGICCALLSIIFCKMLHGTGDLYRKYLKNPYVRIVFSSVIIIILSQLLGTYEYSGSGIPLIEKSFSSQTTPWTFLLKMIFTTLTLEAGFKGGEIVPSFTVGATFGCLFGMTLGLTPSLCAAVGMISVFCGVTNCPITSMIIGFELFGFEPMRFMLIGVSISYMLSGYYGLYPEQTIVYSKYKTQFINRKAKEK